MKALTEMTSRELFCLLTDDRDLVGRTLLQQMILSWREKHPEHVGEGELDLAAVVAEMSREL